MSNTTKANQTELNPELDETTDLASLIKLRDKIDAQIIDTRPRVISEFYNKLVDLCEENKLGLKEFLEIGERSYQAANKKKKSPLSLPNTTGKERKLPVKYSDNENNWSGRGKIPRWLIAHMEDGRKMEEFLLK